MISLARPDITAADIDAAAAVLQSGDLVQGEQVARFEAELATSLGVDHVVVVSSGTAALHAALLALGLGPGDLAIVPGYSWVATANVVEATGARPRFVDIEPGTYAMDPRALARCIESLRASGELRRLKAVIPVHAFGYVAAMDAIGGLVADLGVPIVEDAACALGAALEEEAAGSMGALGCFSFHPRKTITTGEGGAVATDDPEHASFVRRFRNHGQEVSDGMRRFTDVGLNYRLTDAMAALGRSQLERMDQILARRRQLASGYLDALSDLDVTPPAFDWSRTTCQAFVIELPYEADREHVITAMAALGVECAAGTIAIPYTDAYQRRYGLTPSDLPVTYRAGTHAMALPLHTSMEPSDVEHVVSALERAMSAARTHGP